jgi:hypothetical protein
MRARNISVRGGLAAFISDTLIGFRAGRGLNHTQTIELLRSTGVEMTPTLYSRLENRNTVPDALTLLAIIKLVGCAMPLDLITDVDWRAAGVPKRPGRPPNSGKKKEKDEVPA